MKLDDTLDCLKYDVMEKNSISFSFSFSPVWVV